MRNIILSVIIPAYNTSNYLKKCIDSLLFQTLQEIEVIVVDDGSTNDLTSIIDSYGNKENLIYIRNEYSVGPGAARNIGLCQAKGKFIAFCDSDDWVDLDLYEKNIILMEKTDADIGIFSVIRERDGSREKPEYLCHFNQPYTLSSEMALRILSGQYEMGIKLHKACWNKVFRKSFLDISKARFEEGIYFQGVLFCVYTFLRAKKIVCVPHVAYHHYRRSDSIIQSFSEKHIHDFRECYLRMKKYFVEENKFTTYQIDYYRLCESYMNIIVKQTFEFEHNEERRKFFLRKVLQAFTSLITTDEYFAYATAEEIRRHIQPNITDTTLY